MTPSKFWQYLLENSTVLYVVLGLVVSALFVIGMFFVFELVQKSTKNKWARRAVYVVILIIALALGFPLYYFLKLPAPVAWLLAAALLTGSYWASGRFDIKWTGWSPSLVAQPATPAVVTFAPVVILGRVNANAAGCSIIDAPIWPGANVVRSLVVGEELTLVLRTGDFWQVGTSQYVHVGQVDVL